MSEAAPPAEPAPQAPSPPPPATLAAHLRAHAWTIVLAIVFVAVGTQPGYSLYAWLFLIPLLPWLMYTLVRGLVQSKERMRRLPKVALWVLAVAIVLGVTNYNERAVRRQADAALARVNTYYARTHTWPAKLDDTGLDGAALQKQWRIFYRPNTDGPPRLYYAAPHMLFDVWEYDFDTRSWKYQSY